VVGALPLCLTSAAAQPTPASPTQIEQGSMPQPEPAAPPEFAAVEKAIAEYFASLSDHQAGDLIHQSQVEAALDRVLDAGWDVSGRDALMKRVLADGSFLVRELASPAGRKFMRRIARHPGTYSRLERLSTISSGQKLVRDLVRQKDGDKLIEYMATTRGGHNLGRMMAGTRRGVDLNKPTNRIYTAEELVTELMNVYARKK